MPGGGEIIIDSPSLIDGLLDREGGTFTDRPEDSGGPTKWGWTQSALCAVYDRAVSIEAVRNLTREQAAALYAQEHWRRPGFDKLAAISPKVAAKLFDIHVNLPPSRAGEFLQRALNALNKQASLYADVKVDGQIGPATRSALATYLRLRGGEGESVLLELINSQLAVYYLERTEARSLNEFNIYGWVLNRVVKDV